MNGPFVPNPLIQNNLNPLNPVPMSGKDSVLLQVQQRQKQDYLDVCPHMKERTYSEDSWFIATLRKHTENQTLEEVDQAIALLGRVGILQPFDQFDDAGNERFLLRIRVIAWIIICKDQRLPLNWTYILKINNNEPIQLWNILKGILAESPRTVWQMFSTQRLTDFIYPWPQQNMVPPQHPWFRQQKAWFKEHYPNLSAENILYYYIIKSSGSDYVYDALVTLCQVGVLKPLEQISSDVIKNRFEHLAKEYHDGKIPSAIVMGLTQSQKVWFHLLFQHIYDTIVKRDSVPTELPAAVTTKGNDSNITTATTNEEDNFATAMSSNDNNDNNNEKVSALFSETNEYNPWPNGNCRFQLGPEHISGDMPNFGWNFVEYLLKGNKRYYYCLGVMQCPISNCSFTARPLTPPIRRKYARPASGDIYCSIHPQQKLDWISCSSSMITGRTEGASKMQVEHWLTHNHAKPPLCNPKSTASPVTTDNHITTAASLGNNIHNPDAVDAINSTKDNFATSSERKDDNTIVDRSCQHTLQLKPADMSGDKSSLAQYTLWPNGNYVFELKPENMSGGKPSFGWKFVQYRSNTQSARKTKSRFYYCLGVLKCPVSDCNFTAQPVEPTAGISFGSKPYPAEMYCSFHPEQRLDWIPCTGYGYSASSRGTLPCTMVIRNYEGPSSIQAEHWGTHNHPRPPISVTDNSNSHTAVTTTAITYSNSTTGTTDSSNANNITRNTPTNSQIANTTEVNNDEIIIIDDDDDDNDDGKVKEKGSFGSSKKETNPINSSATTSLTPTSAAIFPTDAANQASGYTAWPQGKCSFMVGSENMTQGCPPRPIIGWKFVQTCTKTVNPGQKKKRFFYCLGVMACPVLRCSFTARPITPKGGLHFGAPPQHCDQFCSEHPEQKLQWIECNGKDQSLSANTTYFSSGRSPCTMVTLEDPTTAETLVEHNGFHRHPLPPMEPAPTKTRQSQVKSQAVNVKSSSKMTSNEEIVVIDDDSDDNNDNVVPYSTGPIKSSPVESSALTTTTTTPTSQRKTIARKTPSPGIAIAGSSRGDSHMTHAKATVPMKSPSAMSKRATNFLRLKSPPSRHISPQKRPLMGAPLSPPKRRYQSSNLKPKDSEEVTYSDDDDDDDEDEDEEDTDGKGGNHRRLTWKQFLRFDLSSDEESIFGEVSSSDEDEDEEYEEA